MRFPSLIHKNAFAAGTLSWIPLGDLTVFSQTS